MRRTFIFILPLMIFLSAKTFAEKQTLYVDKNQIYTAAGEQLVMRGFNEMFAWSKDKTGERLVPEIDKTGANTLRLVWDHKFNAKDLVRLIDNTIAHKMIAVPECHNATGKWDDALDACINMWKNPLLIEAIERNRQWTILNIANEAGDYKISDENFLTTYKKAISSLREWGYTVPIMIDASNWGQNVDQLLRVAPRLLAHDPLKNIIFSTHSYWPTEQYIVNHYKVAQKANASGIAMIVGEGPSVTRMGQCDNPVPLPYLEAMKILDEHQTGWLNWSWGGMKNADCGNFRYFDFTKDGRFGYWWHQHAANIIALSPFSVMKTSKRPESFYPDGHVKVSGIYLHLSKIQLAVGEKIKYEVIVAPANAANKKFTVMIEDDKNVIQLDTQNQQLIALRSGKASLVATVENGIKWVTELDIQ
jgi:mannan endo-1,4-beta-mannosidase